MATQVIGSCGGNSPNTDSFKTSHVYKDGRVANVTYRGEGFKYMNDGEGVAQEKAARKMVSEILN
jgi:hypothetical protein